MNGSDDALRLIRIAWQLDRLRWVPRQVLWLLVVREGACMPTLVRDSEPPWLSQSTSDRELAAHLCEGCPVQDECLELELRIAGRHTVGVWGALPEDDRRGVHEHWLRRGERAVDPDTNAGGDAGCCS